MMLVRCRIAPSPIHGIGLFLDEPCVLAGDRVWSFSYATDLVLPPMDVSTWSKSFCEFVARYSYRREGGTRILCGDLAKFMNHSETPTLVGADDDYAARALRVGDELTVNYRTFDLDWEQKLRA